MIPEGMGLVETIVIAVLAVLGILGTRYGIIQRIIRAMGIGLTALSFFLPKKKKEEEEVEEEVPEEPEKPE